MEGRNPLCTQVQNLNLQHFGSKHSAMERRLWGKDRVEREATLFKCLLCASIVLATHTNISVGLHNNPMNSAHFIDVEIKHEGSK